MGADRNSKSGAAAGVKPGPLLRLARALHLELSEVWVKFLIAIVGLGLAFAAALFSSVSRESGNLAATLVLASAALLLATIVGITTVPYLARRVATARIRDAFDYEVTRAGIVYVVVVVAIGIAALNTGNNLLYIIVAAMLAAILVSGLASAIVLRELQLDVRLPEHVFAGKPVMGRILLRNHRLHLPSFSISVVPFRKGKPLKRWEWSATSFGFPMGRPAAKQWLTLPDRQLRRVAEKASTEIFRGSAYFPYIAPQSEVAADLEMRFDKRGIYQQDSFGLSTRFPFAFLAKTRRVALPRQVVVYPSVEAADDFFEVLPLITGEFETFIRGRGYDLYRIRDSMPDDSARHVDWKATAKSGSLKVREFSREDERKVRLVFDNPAPGTLSPATYESAVAMTASLGWHFAGENAEISFAAQNCDSSVDLYGFLRFLATVEPAAGPALIEQLQISDHYNIILTSRPKGSLPTRLWACSYIIFLNEIDRRNP